MYFFLGKQTKISKMEGEFDVQTDSDQEYEFNENDEEFVFPSGIQSESQEIEDTETEDEMEDDATENILRVSTQHIESTSFQRTKLKVKTITKCFQVQIWKYDLDILRLKLYYNCV